MPGILKSVRSLKHYPLVPFFGLLGSRKSSKQERQELCPVVAAFKWQTPTYLSAYQSTENRLLFLCPSLVFLSIVACFHVLDCKLLGQELFACGILLSYVLAGSTKL